MIANNIRFDFKVTRDQLDNFVEYVRESGWQVTRTEKDDVVYYKTDFDWNYGVLAESIKGPGNRWHHFVSVRIPTKPGKQ